MPSRHTSGTRGTSRPVYPHYREEHGEDPARILYHLNPFARIRGLESIDLCNAYLDVETDRDHPRRAVIAALNQRKDELQEDST